MAFELKEIIAAAPILWVLMGVGEPIIRGSGLMKVSGLGQVHGLQRHLALQEFQP